MKEERLKKTSKDIGKAKGLLKRSQSRLRNTENQEINDSNAFIMLENSYEAIREIIEAYMALEGFKSEDHVATIAWASEYLELNKKKINKLHKYRKLRNASRYEAEKITPKQAKETIEFADKIIEQISKKLKEKLT